MNEIIKISNDSFVSVKELNDVFEKMQQFSEKKDIRIEFQNDIEKIDIVFIAGLILHHKQYGTKFGIEYIKDIDTSRLFEVRQYLMHCQKLFDIKLSDVFNKFKGIIKLDEKDYTESESFAPIIYINKENLKYFFGNDKNDSNEKITELKNMYINALKNLKEEDKGANKDEKNYFKQTTNITQELESSAPIYTFIFSVAYHKINPFVKSKDKKDNFNKPTIVIQQIWQFTQEYVRGLHELAKNIVEHSGNNENDGQGMITIRAYSKDETDKTKKDLETHIFDYGTMGIIPKLKDYTFKKVESYKDKTELSESQQNVQNAYTKDFNDNLNETFGLKNFIDGNLEQQKFRHVGHYGINKLHSLIQKPLNGDMYISSKGINGKRGFFNDIDNQMLTTGTHYFIKVPFIPENFSKLYVPINKQQEFATLGSSDALQNLMKKTVKQIPLKELNKENDKFTGILDITINETVNKQSVDDIYTYFDKLSELDNRVIVAINLEKFEENDESSLLRFLGHLTYEYKQTFIIYNLDFELYKKMIDDNTEFAKTRHWESFWHEEKGMLVYTKIQNKNFYFADILYGKSQDNYRSVNKMLSHTFPNSAFIVDVNTQKAQPDSNTNLPDFFDNDALLPYDILLKSENNEKLENKELALYNIKTLLQNDLFHKQLDITIKDNTDVVSYTEILENYVDNFDGYHIAKTHFKIGNKIHSSDFYYAKRLFQNSFYTTRLAMILTKRIIETNNYKTKHIMLVGYEMYSELILSLTENYLTKIFGYNVSHFFAQRKDDKFDFLPEDTFKSYINKYEEWDTIIVVPIAATSSTSQKIEKEIRNKIYEKEIANGKNKEEAELKKNDMDLFKARYNIILAQDNSNDFKDVRNDGNNQNQEPIIKLNTKWYNLKNCGLCYGAETKPLFDTDKSSLTPSIIFGNPEGKKRVANEIENTVVKFDELNFQKSIQYLRVSRNENYRIYDINSDIFIRENESKIKEWLKDIVKVRLYYPPQQSENNIPANSAIYDDSIDLPHPVIAEDSIKYRQQLKSTDKIVIVAPCHESNSKFLNLINDIVFSSSATIIHYQNGVDFVENFNLLNENFLTEKNTKIFYVDDSLISGKHFFEIFDLIRSVTKNPDPLTASIFINDQSVPFVHERVKRWSSNFFAFITFNTPPTFEKHPLEYERERYKLLQNNSLHDTLIKLFHTKVNNLDPSKRNKDGKESSEKQLMHLKMFEAVHKIYDYFANKFPNLAKDDEREKFIDFKLKCNNSSDFYKEDTSRNAILKVLSQYPFILYKDLKEKTFEWHKEWLKKIIETNIDNSDLNKDSDYEHFKTFKFLLSRATFLDNYQVLKEDFLEILSKYFKKIDNENIKKFKEQLKEKEKDLLILKKELSALEKQHQEKELLFDDEMYQKKDEIQKLQKEYDEFKNKVENLCDFPIFVLSRYIEMIQKNEWVAYHILKNMENIRKKFEESTQGKRFFRMMKIEVASVIDDFMQIIEKQPEWKNMFKTDKELIIETNKIIAFCNDKEILKSNEFVIVDSMFPNETKDLKKSKLIYYLWIKQLLYADKSNYLKTIDYEKKINAIIDKIKLLFSKSEIVNSFFIVTDGQNKPHVLNDNLKDNDSLLSGFSEDFEVYDQLSKDMNKEKDESLRDLLLKQIEQIKTSYIIKFLNGVNNSINGVVKTTVELVFDGNEWKDIYDDDSVEKESIKFISADLKYRWLYLIHISTFNENNGDFKTQGLLGFYSEENLNDEFLPKQFLMLLRKDMSVFIERHHKNDEFSGLIQRKKEDRYSFLLNHGTQTYRNTIYENLEDIENENLKKTLNALFDYLLIKLNLLTNVNSENKESESISLSAIKEEIEKYKFVFSVKCAQRGKIELNDMNDLVSITYNDFANLDCRYEFPKNSYKDIIFEILFNIRKHVIKSNTFTKDSKLVIDISIENRGVLNFLTISNNYFGQLEEKDPDKSKPHGIDLIKEMWTKYKLGSIEIEKPTGTNKNFKISIPLKIKSIKPENNNETE